MHRWKEPAGYVLKIDGTVSKFLLIFIIYIYLIYIFLIWTISLSFNLIPYLDCLPTLSNFVLQSIGAEEVPDNEQQ